MLGLGAHGIDIGEQGLDGTFVNALSVCGRFGLTIDEAVTLWREVANVVDNWKDIFSAQRVTGADIDYIASFLDSEDKLAFSALSGIRPMIETMPLERAAEAYEKMMSGNARFRMVITTAQ